MEPKKGIPARTSLFSAKLKGGALYIALIVSILVAVTLSLFIFISRYNQRTVTEYTQASQLYQDLYSAFEIARSDDFTDAYNNRWLKNSYNEDSIKINRRYWGAYLVISAKAKNRHQSLSQSGLYGTYMSADTGLVMADNGRPLGLSGTVAFKAACYLPESGIRPATIEGQSYTGAISNSAFIRHSPSRLPYPHPAFLDGIANQRVSSYTDSMITALPPSLSQPFSGNTVACRVNAGRLSRVQLKNNIRLIATEIEIDSSCRFDNVLIVCNKVRFRSGFKGKVHVIASDSIIAEAHCRFQFPSSFVLCPEEEQASALRYIQLSDDCRFFGAILALHRSELPPTSGTQVFVKLHTGSEVNGLVYSAAYLQAEGSLNATAICNKLMIKTASAVYENHLRSCSIDPGKYAGTLVIPQIFGQKRQLLCCERTDQDKCSY